MRAGPKWSSKEQVNSSLQLCRIRYTVRLYPCMCALVLFNRNLREKYIKELTFGIARASVITFFLSTGSDNWKVAEKKLFNKGIAIYKKDFFLVQKLVSYFFMLFF